MSEATLPLSGTVIHRKWIWQVKTTILSVAVISIHCNKGTVQLNLNFTHVCA